MINLFYAFINKMCLSTLVMSAMTLRMTNKKKYEKNFKRQNCEKNHTHYIIFSYICFYLCISAIRPFKLSAIVGQPFIVYFASSISFQSKRIRCRSNINFFTFSTANKLILIKQMACAYKMYIRLINISLQKKTKSKRKRKQN